MDSACVSVCEGVMALIGTMKRVGGGEKKWCKYSQHSEILKKNIKILSN